MRFEAKTITEAKRKVAAWQTLTDNKKQPGLQASGIWREQRTGEPVFCGYVGIKIESLGNRYATLTCAEGTFKAEPVDDKLDPGVIALYL